MAKQIPLTRGQFSIVDDEDFEWLNQWKWCAYCKKGTQAFYAVRGVRNGKKTVTISMHRLILGATKGVYVDHRKPEDTLNNQRSNLRIATPQQSAHNRRGHRDSSSGCKGVVYLPSSNKWQAKIYLNSRVCSLGVFTEKIEAARAYDRAALKHFGEFALLNFAREEYING